MSHYSKIKYLFLLPTFLLCGCSESDVVTNAQGGKEASQDSHNVMFRLQSNTSAVTRSAEDSYSYVQGTANEYQVNTARVYLFDHQTRLLAKSIRLTQITYYGTDAGGHVIYETEKVPVSPGTYDIFVTANTDRVIKAEQEDAFLADIDSLTYARALIDDISGGIVMTNRASDNVATVIATNNTSDASVVSISLERVLARIDVAKASDTFEMTDKSGKKYASVTLDGFYIVNLPRYYYSYRHTAVLTTMDEPAWDINTNFGNVADVDGYVIDPYFFMKRIDASRFTNADGYYEHFSVQHNDPRNIPWTAFNAAATDPVYKTAYCLENCCMTPAQENGYSTGVIFRAKMTPNNNVYRLDDTGNLQLITDQQQYPEVLYYWQYQFYASTDALLAAVTASGESEGKYQARKFEKTDDGYRCYYNYWIRHLDNYKPTEMGVMEFAIVRNNLYRLCIAGVSDLGAETVEIVPDRPDEGETELKVVIEVRPWTVRDLTNIVL